jgi:RNA polymerase sigma-70 factor (ECF subfamily)
MATDNLEAIWDHFCCRLKTFINSRVSDEGDAEDILQEVFLRIHRHLCCLPEADKLDSWVYQIARNLIIDHYRRRKELVEIPESLPAEMDIPEEDLETELAGSLKEMIDELPELYRQALILSEYQGLNQNELAEKLGISLSGAKSRVQRARRMLRDMLLACCHFEMDRRGRILDYYPRCNGCSTAAEKRASPA